MIINTIDYQKKFNLGNFSNEEMRFNATLEAGDDLATCMKILHDKMEELHRQNNPQLWEQVVEVTLPVEDEFKPDYHKGKSVRLSKDDITTLSLAEQIRTCTTLKVLESYKLLIKKDEQAKAAYLEMLEKLSKKENA